MAETRSGLRRRRVAFGSRWCSLGAIAFLVVSISQHQDAATTSPSARSQLATRRAATSNEFEERAHHAQRRRDRPRPAGALEPGVAGLADLDQKDLDAVRAAIQGGLAGKLADYNAAVDQRTALDPQHDAALEQLRQQANAVITALDPLR